MRFDAAPMIESEESLVRRAARGDREAWADLYRRHVDAVWTRLHHLVGPDPEREDLIQQIFLEVFQGLPRFRGEATFSTYLYRVQINMVYDHLKRRRRRPLSLTAEMFQELECLDASPERTAQSHERLLLIWAALQRMKPKKRVALVLAVMDELSLKEISGLVQASTATVAKRIEQARKELKSVLNRREAPR